MNNYQLLNETLMHHEPCRKSKTQLSQGVEMYINRTVLNQTKSPNNYSIIFYSMANQVSEDTLFI